MTYYVSIPCYVSKGGAEVARTPNKTLHIEVMAVESESEAMLLVQKAIANMVREEQRSE